MGKRQRWLRDLRFFAAAAAIAMVFLPLAIATLAYLSRQAMFWPAYESLYTYFLPYTVAASLALGLLALVFRVFARWIRRLRARSSG